MILLATAAVALPMGLYVIVAHREHEPSPPFFGIDVPQADPGHVTRLARQLGCGPTVMNRFVKLDSRFVTSDLTSLAEGDRTPMVSLEPWSWRMRSGQTDAPAYSLDALARGAHDSALRAVARVLATHHGPVLVRFAHEMNADWYPWGAVVNGNSTSSYVRAWRHVHDVMSAVAPRIRWVWSPLAAWWPDAMPLRSVYPGDRYVDYVAASGYGHGGTAEQTFGRWYSEVRSFTDRPALLSETGAEGETRSEWIASLVPFLRDRPDIRGFVWFDTSPETTGATGDYRIDDDPASIAALRAALRDLRVPCLPSSGGTATPDP